MNNKNTINTTTEKENEIMTERKDINNKPLFREPSEEEIQFLMRARSKQYEC